MTTPNDPATRRPDPDGDATATRRDMYIEPEPAGRHAEHGQSAGFGEDRAEPDTATDHGTGDLQGARPYSRAESSSEPPTDASAETRTADYAPSPADAQPTQQLETHGSVPADSGNWDATRTTGYSPDWGTGHPGMAAAVAPDRETVLAREKERFGGMKFGAGFFGWLTATGMAVLLLGILAATGVAFGLTTQENVDRAVQESENVTGTAQTVGLVGAIVLLVILFVAYFCGGYVAGRMSRFDGAKQGIAVWLWAIVTTAVIAILAVIFGPRYNVLADLQLPRIPVDEGSVTWVGIIAVAAALVAALIGAVLGGLVGTRFHRRVDAAGFDATADQYDDATARFENR